MNKAFYLILSISLFFSCENSPSSESTPEDKQVQTGEKETKPSRTRVEDDDRVSGYFDLKIDGKTYKSTQLQDNYCDMTFLYKGEESFVTIRFKDVESNDALLLTFYGDKEFMLDPSGTIESFMYSDAGNKANLQFLPGDGNGSIMSLTMVEGSITVSNFAKGKIEATFEGMGGKPKDVVTKKNLIPFKGEIVLETKNVSEMGKDKEG